MKPTYNKGLLIFLSIILFFLFCFLIYLVLLKREYNIVEESKNSTTSSTTTTTKPNLTTLNQTTLTDLNLNLGEDFTKTFPIKLGQNNSNLKIENTYTETTTNQTNHLSFYLNDKLCQELNQVFDKTTNTNNLEFNYLSTYKDEYLVLSYLSPLNNYNIQEEYVYFCNDRASLNLKSIYQDNLKVNINNSQIYYYSISTGEHDLTTDFTSEIYNHNLQVNEYYLEIENNEFSEYTKTNNTTTITP